MLASGVTTLGAASIMGVSTVSAATQSGQTGQTLADRLATTFHLKKSDVQKVIDEDRQAHQADMQKQLENRLAQAVKDGKITSAQKTLILNKLSELQKAHEANKNTNMTDAQRKAAMDKEIADLKAWAKANNIPTNLVMPPMGPGPNGGPKPSDSSSN